MSAKINLIAEVTEPEEEIRIRKDLELTLAKADRDWWIEKSGSRSDELPKAEIDELIQIIHLEIIPWLIFQITIIAKIKRWEDTFVTERSHQERKRREAEFVGNRRNEKASLVYWQYLEAKWWDNEIERWQLQY